MAIKYSIPTPKSPFIDLKSGLVSRDWFLYLNNVFGSVSTLTGTSSVTASTGTLATNQLVIADGPSDIVSLNSLVASSVVVATSSGAIATQPGPGTSTTVLHGNASSFPFYSAVKLTADVSGVLPVASGGTNASTALNNNRLMLSSSGSIVEATSLANGQIFIGSTGAAPVASTLTASTGISVTNGAGSISVALNASTMTSSLTGDVSLVSTASYFDGPTVAQGSTGTWYVSGSVVLADAVSSAALLAKLWDGTNVIDTGFQVSVGAGQRVTIALSGATTNPAGNLRISARDATTTTGTMQFNASATSKDCTITAIRIG